LFFCSGADISFPNHLFLLFTGAMLLELVLTNNLKAVFFVACDPVLITGTI
jgi:hypothetical protein